MPDPRMRPRDAATLVIVDRTGPAPRVLMGRRHPDQVFLPDTFVFPGGRVEPQDRARARRHALPAGESARLKLAMRGRPSDTRAAALALAAVRETFEETGLRLGEAGGCPRLDRLAFFARAITPPGRPRRYDTRFFIVDAAHVAERTATTDGELRDIDWFTLERAGGLKLPSITRHVLEDIRTLIDGSLTEVGGRPVPFYRHVRGRFERTLLTAPIVQLDTLIANSMVRGFR